MELTEIFAGLTEAPEGVLSFEVPADWQQGRTLYGGLNTALMVAAARRSGGDLGPLRALQIAFLAPAEGHVRLVPSTLREGRSVSFVGVDVFAGETFASRGVLTFGRARETDVRHSRLSPPRVPEPSACPAMPLQPGVTPAFLEHMDLRIAGGSPPLSGGDPELSMWVRHRGATALDAELALIAVADVLPPAVLSSLNAFRGGSSVTWSIDLAAIPPDPTDWYLMQTTSDHAADGYSAQAMTCFGPDGALAAVSRQTVATF